VRALLRAELGSDSVWAEQLLGVAEMVLGVSPYHAHPGERHLKRPIIWLS